MIRQCTVKPVWISHALKRRPCSDGQARLMLSVFYMLSFHAILKRKTVKRTLIQTDNIIIPQIKKHPALRGHKWKFRNFDKHRIKLDISDNFIKKKHFLHFKQQKFFLISVCSFERVQHFWLELCIFYSTLLSATN